MWLPIYSFTSSFSVRNPEIRYSIRVGRRRSPAQSQQEEEGAADMRPPPVSEMKKGEATAPSVGPAHARGRKSGAAASARFSGPRAGGGGKPGRAAQQVSYLSFFLFVFKTC
jgi:hypothetical protein